VAPFTALYDACVLYPAPLRDLLMWLAVTELFRARWSAAIHEEWIRNLLEARSDLSRERLERTRDLMNRSVLNCLVEGYEPLIPGLSLPDPDDRHVLAAALHGGATVIVTYNLADFPKEALEPHGIEALHPDEFILSLFDLAPGPVCATVKKHRQSLKKPAKTVAEYLETLARLSLPQTVAQLQGFADLI
jgi:predicted nucleic acid-binding protein